MITAPHFKLVRRGTGAAGTARAGERAFALRAAWANKTSRHLILLGRANSPTPMLTDEAGEHYSAAGGFLRSTSTHYLLLREADLKVTSKFGEARKLEELLAGGWLVDNLVLKHPGEVMGNEDSIQTG